MLLPPLCRAQAKTLPRMESHAAMRAPSMRGMPSVTSPTRPSSRSRVLSALLDPASWVPLWQHAAHSGGGAHTHSVVIAARRPNSSADPPPAPTSTFDEHESSLGEAAGDEGADPPLGAVLEEESDPEMNPDPDPNLDPRHSRTLDPEVNPDPSPRHSRTLDSRCGGSKKSLAEQSLDSSCPAPRFASTPNRLPRCSSAEGGGRQRHRTDPLQPSTLQPPQPLQPSTLQPASWAPAGPRAAVAVAATAADDAAAAAPATSADGLAMTFVDTFVDCSAAVGSTSGRLGVCLSGRGSVAYGDSFFSSALDGVSLQPSLQPCRGNGNMLGALGRAGMLTLMDLLRDTWVRQALPVAPGTNAVLVYRYESWAWGVLWAGVSHGYGGCWWAGVSHGGCWWAGMSHGYGGCSWAGVSQGGCWLAGVSHGGCCWAGVFRVVFISHFPSCPVAPYHTLALGPGCVGLSVLP